MTVAKFRVGTSQMRSQVDGMTVFNTSQVDSTKQKMFFGVDTQEHYSILGNYVRQNTIYH